MKLPPSLLLLLTTFTHLCFSLTNEYKLDSLTNTQIDGYPAMFATASHHGPDKYYIKEKSTIAQGLNISVIFESNTEFTVKITRAEAPPRFTMDHKFPYSYTKTHPEDVTDMEYAVAIKNEPLSVSVQRLSTEETLFDTSSFNLIYSEFFINFGTKLPSGYLYGMGERRTRHFLYKSGLYTIWCKDQFAQIDDGIGNGETYGAHPVYLVREASGRWHMVYLRTTNALDFKLDTEKQTLEYMVTGGEIELKFFLGSEYPETAIKQYHNYINKWTLQPFWSFGYHQCRWGYMFLEDMLDVHNSMVANNLPMDVIWSDIDYMDNFTDFTIDFDRYPIAPFQELLTKVRWIPIIDAGVALNYTSPAYQTGEKYEVWIRSALNHSNYLVGVVWPGLVHWPDWLNPNASKYWNEMLDSLYQLLPFSGIWIDMDENSNFCEGEWPYNCFWLPNYLPKTRDQEPNITAKNIIGVKQTISLPAEVNPVNDTFEFVKFNSTDLPYLPGNSTLENHGLSLNALHYGKVLSFDFHNLDPFLEAKLTYDAQLDVPGKTQKRPFVLTRGNFVGTGQFAAHWTGDNSATWEFFRLSIAELFNLQIFGIPMVGADICGFAEDTNEELCARWMQLGAFYPFMRNHNQLGTVAQEPYALGPTVLETSRAALNFRYSILKFYYSVMVRANGTGGIFRPLFFDFPNDVNLYDLQTQFLIGTELMVASPTDKGMKKIPVYFPSGARWYDFKTGNVMADFKGAAKNLTVKAPLNDTLPVFIKGGSIVHMQNVRGIRRSDDLDNKFDLVVALVPITSDTSVAFGQIMGVNNYLDDVAVDLCVAPNDCMINVAVEAFVEEAGKVSASVSFDKRTLEGALQDIYISSVKFLGVRTRGCDFDEVLCELEEYVIQCVYNQPRRVEVKTEKFTLTKDGCTWI